MLFRMKLVLKAKGLGMKLMIITDNLGEAVGDIFILVCVQLTSLDRRDHCRQQHFGGRYFLLIKKQSTSNQYNSINLMQTTSKFVFKI